MKKQSLTTYLQKYYEYQNNILLVYRPETKSSWRDRCKYLGEGYDSLKAYNHRSVLDCEVIFEYDTDNPSENRRLVDEIAKKLSKDNIKWSKWGSGNKSTHLHCLFKVKDISSFPTFKRMILRYYSSGLPLPDMRLAGENHLIRAEFGIHEATGNHKSLISFSPGYPEQSRVPEHLWAKYTEDLKNNMRISIGVRSNNTLTKLKGFKFLLNPEDFRVVEDGRERVLFMLIHVLKEGYKEKEDLVKFLWDWYKYSGGFKLSESDVRRKVVYHWNRTYFLTERFLNELLEELGLEKFIRKEGE